MKRRTDTGTEGTVMYPVLGCMKSSRSSLQWRLFERGRGVAVSRNCVTLNLIANRLHTDRDLTLTLQKLPPRHSVSENLSHPLVLLHEDGFKGSRPKKLRLQPLDV